MVKNDRVVVAVPKGLLYEDACTRLREAGIAIPADPGRRLHLSVPGGNGELLIVRPSDIPAYVASGAADCGIVGKDTLWESDCEIEELADLEFGVCRLALAGRRIDGYQDGTPLPDPVRVATRFVRTTRAYFEGKGIACEIVALHGSVELGPIVGLSDVVVDLVSTGRTLREHDMVIIDELDRSSARLIAGKNLLPERYDLVTSLLDRLVMANAV